MMTYFDDDFGDDFDDDDFDDDDFGDDDFSDTDFGADRLNDERTASAKRKRNNLMKILTLILLIQTIKEAKRGTWDN